MKSIFKTLFPWSSSPGDVPILSERFPESKLNNSTVLGLFAKLSGSRVLNPFSRLRSNPTKREMSVSIGSFHVNPVRFIF